MQIKRKLEYPLWKVPFFLIKSLFISIQIIRTGILSLLIENKYFNKQIELILRILNVIFGNNNQEEIGKKLSKVLINLGPGYIKFGQALSTRPDILGKKTCDELKILQGQLKPFSNSVAKKIIEEENENLLQESLASFDENPIASASVAQVHTGILKNGIKVAIKILKPNIHEQLFKDFTFFYWITKFLEFFVPSIKRLKLSKNVEVLSEVSLNELDLTLEASAADELAENFKDHQHYKVPKIYWEFTTKNMLVLEFIEGIRIDDLEALKASDHNIKNITEIGTEVFFLQVFRDGFFHGDMHPGNILIDKDGALIPIDFGIMGRLSNKDRQFLALLLTYLLNKNYRKVVEIHDEANMLGKDVSHDHLSQAIRAISTPLLNKPIGEVSLAKLLGQILSLSKKFNIEVQPQFTLLQKTMLMAEGTTRQINPNINMWELSRPLIDKWITDTHDPFKVLEEWFHKNKIALLKIPEIINKIDEILSKK